jgi:cytochrome c biogenesis protein CcmG/thiol:disulfide interchange protein DsbE
MNDAPPPELASMNVTAPAKRASLWLWLPLALFFGFFLLVMSGLISPGDREVASAMVGKPLPPFALRPAVPDRPGLARADMADGKPRLLNIFASWCIPCAVESPQLAALAAQGVEIDGVAIRDRQDDVQRFLAQNGNPFRRIGADDLSSIQLAIGSSGVPETFVIDGRGVIRHQHIGDIRAEDVPAILEKLREAGR